MSVVCTGFLAAAYGRQRWTVDSRFGNVQRGQPIGGWTPLPGKLDIEDITCRPTRRRLLPVSSQHPSAHQHLRQTSSSRWDCQLENKLSALHNRRLELQVNFTVHLDGAAAYFNVRLMLNEFVSIVDLQSGSSLCAEACSSATSIR